MIVYEVEFSDGQIKEYAVNFIAENMLSQINSDSFSKTLMYSIVDYKKDDVITVTKSEKNIVNNRGHWRLCKSMAV